MTHQHVQVPLKWRNPHHDFDHVVEESTKKAHTQRWNCIFSLWKNFFLTQSQQILLLVQPAVSSRRHPVWEIFVPCKLVFAKHLTTKSLKRRHFCGTLRASFFLSTFPDSQAKVGHAFDAESRQRLEKCLFWMLGVKHLKMFKKIRRHLRSRFSVLPLADWRGKSWLLWL